MSIPQIDLLNRFKSSYSKETCIRFIKSELKKVKPFSIDLDKLAQPPDKYMDNIKKKLAELVLIAKYANKKELRSRVWIILFIFFGMNDKKYTNFINTTFDFTIDNLLNNYDWLLYPDKGSNRQKASKALWDCSN